MSSTSRLSSNYAAATVDNVTALQPGDAVPQLEKRVSRLQSTLFCASIRFAHQVHFDDAMCRAQGWNGVILPGFLLGNWCIEAVTRMLGPTSVVRSVSFRMAAVAYPESNMKVSGSITDIASGGGVITVTCVLNVVDETDAVVTRATVSATVPLV